ncbi:MAG: NAD(P)-dependent alcohol dehydrogenase [Bacteroidetes bacterium]|nr:NAD(P)-dependent alcohol dehydrogenase [Bacteroidota bacterium]
MKAAFRKQYCEPTENSGFAVRELNQPALSGDDDILLEVKFSTISRSDAAVLTGKPFVMHFVCGLFKPRYPITGTDFAGIVVSVGKNVKDVRERDALIGFHDSGCASHANYMVVKPSVKFVKASPDADLQKLAASVEGLHYARNFLNKVKIDSGMRIMINGGTGAIGSAAIQLLRALHSDIYIVATCKKEDFELVKRQGADRTIDYLNQDFTQDSERFDLVLDCVGKSRFGLSKNILKQNGTYISSELGPYWQNLYLPLFNVFRGGKKVVFPVPTGVTESLNLANELCSKGRFNPMVDRVISIEDVVDGFAYVMSGEKKGVVLIKM